MAWVVSAIAVPRAPEQTTSLYLGLMPGERVDLAVLGLAMAAYAEAIKEISYTFEPGIEFKIDFDGSETGSVKLRTLLRAATSKKATTRSLISIAVTVGVAFGKHIPGDLRTYGVGKLIDAYVLPSQKQELSDNDVERIAKKVVEVQEGRLAKPQIEGFIGVLMIVTRIGTALSLNPRRRLQHLQRPAPPDLSQDAPGIPSLSHPDVARGRRRGMTAIERSTHCAYYSST